MYQAALKLLPASYDTYTRAPGVAASSYCREHWSPSASRLTSTAIVELSTANPPAGNQQRPVPHEALMAGGKPRLLPTSTGGSNTAAASLGAHGLAGHPEPSSVFAVRRTPRAATEFSVPSPISDSGNRVTAISSLFRLYATVIYPPENTADGYIAPLWPLLMILPAPP